MGSSSSHIKYDLRIIFYGNTPREIVQSITANNEISNINNEYFLYQKYNWYMFFKIMNRNISSINDIDSIINNSMPNRNRIIFKKNVIVCFVQLLEAINMLQNYQKQFFENNNIEDDMPYFIFNKYSLNGNNQHLWDLKILFIEEKEVINISAINQNLQLYQTDFLFEDFLKCKIFRNFNDIREIYRKLEQLKARNEYVIKINNNTEKLEITFHINQRPVNEENRIHFNEEELNNLNSTSETEYEEKKSKKKKKKELITPIRSSKKCEKTYTFQKSNTKILSNDYDGILIVEQNIFIHVSIIDLLEDERTLVNALLDAANYFNYLPLNIDENRTCYNSFNIMSIGKSQSGKSILMNKIAGKNITHSTQGCLRTEDIFMRDIYNGKINLYDTCGASNNFLPKDIYSKLKTKIDLLKDNGEKIDLLLIVIKKGDIPDRIIFKDLIIKLIRLNLNFLVVINYFERVENSIRTVVKNAFLLNEFEVDDSNIVEVNILKDITPLFAKIFEKFRNSRITSEDFINENLINISNLSNYCIQHDLLLYRGISFDDIFKRKNWEADKLYTKYLIYIIGSNFIPILNLVLPLILTLKVISNLHNIYLGQPLFNSTFFNNLRRMRNINGRQFKRLLKNLAKKTGIKIFLKIGAAFGIKSSIKVGTSILGIFPLVGELINIVIGNIIDIPTFNKDFNESKNEFLQKLKSRPNMAIRKIVQDYNDAINFFGKRANININQNYYIIPGDEIYNNNINNIIEDLDNLNINELLIDDDQEINDV